MDDSELKEEIESLQKIKSEWTKKKNALRLAEARETDASKLHSIAEEIKLTKDKISEIDNELEDLFSKSSEAMLDVNESLSFKKLNDSTHISDEIKEAIEVLNQESKELGYKSTQKDIQRILDLKTKIYNKIFHEVETQLEFVSSKKDLMYSSALFERIYTSKKLDSSTIIEIQKIRDDYDNYKWYDRCVVVSALTLNLFNFNFNGRKANILLDFVTDFEENVWERSLVGIILVILVQKNRSWLRATTFMKRLQTLKTINHIQEGIRIIEDILGYELYRSNLQNKKCYELNIFKNIICCFLPFYDGNEILENAIDNASKDFEIDRFINFIKTVPLTDAHKYALCLSLGDNKVVMEKMTPEEKYFLNLALKMADGLNPFYNIISMYFNFFNYYPATEINNIFEKQILIAETDLKKYILNKKMLLLLEGDKFRKEKKWVKAISKYQAFLKIVPNKKDVLWRLAGCFLKKKDFHQELQVLLKIESNTSKIDFKLLLMIAECYNSLKSWESSIQYCNKFLKNKVNPSSSIYILLADNYLEINQLDKTEEFCIKAKKNAKNDIEKHHIGSLFSRMGKFQEAISLYEEVTELKPDKSGYWLYLGNEYLKIFEWEKAISSLMKAIKLDPKNYYTKMSLARAYVLSNRELSEAQKILNKITRRKTSKNLGVYYGNWGHLFLVQRKEDQAIKKYSKSIKSLSGADEFKEKMDMDCKYMNELGISTEYYNGIRDRVINDFKNSNGSKEE